MRSIESLCAHQKAPKVPKGLHMTDTQVETLGDFVSKLVGRKVEFRCFSASQPKNHRDYVIYDASCEFQPDMAGGLAVLFKRIKISFKTHPAEDDNYREGSLRFAWDHSQAAGLGSNGSTIWVVYHKGRWWLHSDWEELRRAVFDMARPPKGPEDQE